MPACPPPHRRLLALSVLLLGAVQGAVVPAVGADPAPAPIVEIPVGIPIAIDGVPQPGEWDDALACPLSTDGPVLRIKQARGTLLFSLTTTSPWPNRGHFLLYAAPDAADGTWTAPGACTLDFEPFEHNRPHALVRQRTATGWAAKDAEAVVRTAGLTEAATLEGALPLSLVGVTAKTTRLRWLVGWIQPGRHPTYVTYPQGLDVGATRGPPPQDLATTGRWALSTPFPGAGGPSAFSETEWNALVAADAERTQKGAKANDLALRHMGEIGTGSGEELPKRDAELESGVISPLAWIAAREKLTHTDVRAWATALWRQNRAPEALALLESLVATDPSDEAPDDERLAAMVAADDERYEVAAAHWERVATLLPAHLRPPYVGAARNARALAVRLAAEKAARAEDAAKDDQPLALLRTSKGDVLVRLLEDDVPSHVTQFVHLAETAKTEDGKPFYAGTLFHRVVANGLAQGGDPKSRTEGCEAAGSGGSPWWVPAEKNARHAFYRGSVGFAMGPDGKVRSQFFVMTGPKPKLADTGFAVFGTVIAGMDVVDRLEACDTLLSVSILRKRDHPYEPKKSY